MRVGIDPVVWHQHAWLNRWQSLLLLLAMVGFLALLGGLLAGAIGILILLLVGVVLVLFTPVISPQWIMYLYGAWPLSEAQAPMLYEALRQLAQRAGLTVVPTLYYLPSRIVNAFTAGYGERALLAVSDGLLRSLDGREQIAVLAHEISHIRANDMWVMGLADVFSRLTSLCSLFGQILLVINLPLLLMSEVTINWFAIFVLIFAPGLSALAQLGLSRMREYDADLNAVRLTGDPQGLARALIKIERVQDAWFERLFLPGRRLPEPSLLRTHPATEERVARLLELQPQDEPVWGDQAAPFADTVYDRDIRRAPRWHIGGLWH